MENTEAEKTFFIYFIIILSIIFLIFFIYMLKTGKGIKLFILFNILILAFFVIYTLDPTIKNLINNTNSNANVNTNNNSNKTVRQLLTSKCPKITSANGQISSGNLASYDDYLFSACETAGTCDKTIEYIDPVSKGILNKKEPCGEWNLFSTGWRFNLIDKWRKFKYIINGHKRYITPEGNVNKNGQKIIQWDLIWPEKERSSQHWNYENNLLQNGFGKCLASSDDNNIIQAECNKDSRNQQWFYSDDTTIKDINGKCLSTQNDLRGQNIVLSDCNKELPGHKFYFI